jgi:hypothetical protein
MRLGLENWQLVAPVVQSWLSQPAAFLSTAPEAVALAAMLLPIALAAFSKRLIVLLGCVLLAVVSFCALITPSDIAVTLATGAYLGSMIIAVSGVVARRKAGIRRAEFVRLREDVKHLREDVKHLLNDQQRRFLTSLKSSEKEGIDQKSLEKEGVDQNRLLHEPSGALSPLPEIASPRPNPGPHRSMLYFMAFTAFLFVAICVVMLVAATAD